MIHVLARRRGHALSCIAFILALVSFTLATPKTSEKANETITAHSAVTLDAAVAPFKGLLAGNLMSKDCSPSSLSNVQKDFVNFTRLYQSVDFPRDIVKHYSAVPLMLYIGFVILVFWILATLIFCILRCCLRKTGCCTPVLYGSKQNRKRNELLCFIVYCVALGLFTISLILIIIAICLFPKLGKDLDKGMIQPLWAYATTLPEKVNKLGSGIDTSIRVTVNSIVSGLDLNTVGGEAGKYFDAKFPEIESSLKDLYTTAKQYLDGSVAEDMYKYIDQLEEQLNGDGLGELMSNTEDLKTAVKALKENKEVVELIFDIDKLIDKGFNLIKEKIFGVASSNDDVNSNSANTSINARSDGDSDFDFVAILDTNKMVSTFQSCVLTHFQTDSKEPLYCVFSKLGTFLNTAGLTEQLMDMLDEELDDLKTDITNLSKDLQDNYISIAKEYVTVVSKFLNGTLEEPITEILKLINGAGSSSSSSTGGDSTGDATSSGIPVTIINVANGFLKYFLLIIIIEIIVVFIGFYILPISLALCLRKRNRKHGKCQCKAWIKTSTCCCSCGLPLGLIIISAIGLMFAIIHYLFVAVLLNTDSSNLEGKYVTPKKGDPFTVPAPIGASFNKCVMRGYGSKRYLIESLVIGSDDSTNSSGDNKNNGTKTNAEESSGLSKIGDDALDVLLEQTGEVLPSLLLCPGSPDFVEPEDKPKDEEGWNSYYMEKYGTFFSSLKLDLVVDKVVNKVITRENIQILVPELTGKSAVDKKKDPILKLLDDELQPLIEQNIGELADTFSQNFSKEAIKNSGFNIDEVEGQIKTYAEITNLFDTSKSKDFGFKLVGDATEIGTELCKKKSDMDTAINSGAISVNKNYKEDLDALFEGCNGSTWRGVVKDGEDQDVVFKNHNFKTFLEDTKSYLAKDKTGTFTDLGDAVDTFLGYFDEYKDIFTLLNNVIGILYKAINSIEPVLDKVTKLVTDISENKEKYYVEYEKIPYLQTNKYAFTDGLVTSLKKSTSSVGNKLANMSVDQFGGLLTCYPIGASANTIAGLVNTMSHMYVLLTFTLCLNAFGCLIMIIAANMGPIVYNEKYKYKCCCCCYTPGWKKKSKAERNALKSGDESTIAAGVLMYKNDVEASITNSSDSSGSATSNTGGSSYSTSVHESTKPPKNKTTTDTDNIEYPSVPDVNANVFGASSVGETVEFSSSRPANISEETTLNKDKENIPPVNKYNSYNPYDEREVSSAGGSFPINDDEYQL